MTEQSLGGRALDAARGADEIVFVCSGNMVRSAFAELYARHLGCPTRVRSAGTTYRNDRIFPETAIALLERGVERLAIEGFRPTHIDDMRPAPSNGAVLFAMTDAHLAELRARPALPANVHLLAEVLGTGGEILDPVLEGASFGRTFESVERCVEALVAALR